MNRRLYHKKIVPPVGNKAIGVQDSNVFLPIPPPGFVPTPPLPPPPPLFFLGKELK